VALLAGICVGLFGCGGAPPPQPPPPPPQSEARLFAPDSFWNKPLPADAQLDPASTALVTTLVAEIARERQAGIGPWIQTDHSSTPLYVVGRKQRKRRVRLDLPLAPWNLSLRRAFARVPIPRNLRPAAGTDRHVTIWQPSTDRLWELWRARRARNGWHAEWGGAIDKVSRNPGYYTESAWRGAMPHWGATATSLPVIGGTMLIRELQAGRIDHALAIDIPDARRGTFAWPAQRTDGTGGPNLLPEGARLRLDPGLDINSLGLPPMARAMAEAAQRYGMVVRDRTHEAVGFYGEDPTPTGSDPYEGEGGFFGGQSPSALLERFPWDRLQVVKMSLCEQAPCARRGSP
jgi:hypothetical protein